MKLASHIRPDSFWDFGAL